MNRLQVGTTVCQHLFSVSAPSCLFTQPVLCPKLPDFYKFYNNLNATYRSIETRTKSVRLLQRQYIDRQIKLAQKFCSTAEDKKSIVFANKSVREQFHGVLEQNKERLRETEQKLRARGVFILNDIKETKDKMKEKMEGVIEKENVYTIPNLLCIARITASPFLGYLIIEQNYHFAFGMLVAAGVTDLMDGWIARTWKSQSSNLGSFLDPMADKVLVATLFLSLTYCELIPVALTGLIIVRDSLLVLAGFVIRYRSLPPPRTLSRYFDVSHATANLKPTFISKCNTAVQLVLVASTLAAPVFEYVDHPALHTLWFITGFTTVASALSYVFSKNTYTFLKDRKT